MEQHHQLLFFAIWVSSALLGGYSALLADQQEEGTFLVLTAACFFLTAVLFSGYILVVFSSGVSVEWEGKAAYSNFLTGIFFFFIASTYQSAPILTTLLFFASFGLVAYRSAMFFLSGRARRVVEP